MAIVVPDYQAHIAPEGAANARVPDSAPAEAFGGGEVAAGPARATEGLNQAAFGIAHTEWERANQVAVLDADNKLSTIETGLMYDPQKGALTKRGKDVMGLPEQVLGDYKKGADSIAAGLTNEEQRIAFSHMANSRQYSLERLVQRHVDGQMRDYDAQVTDAKLKNARNEAVLNWEDAPTVEAKIMEQKAAIVDHAKANGMSADWVRQMSEGAESSTRAGVLKQMVNSGQDLAARDYFTQNKATFYNANDQEDATRLLKEGKLRGESQRQADEIIFGGPNTNGSADRTEALEKAREVEDPDIRDMVEARVNKHFSEQKEGEHERQTDAYNQSANLVDKNRNVPVRDLINADTWTQMTPEQRDALQRRAENPANDDKAWLKFLDLSSSPVNLAKLSQADFETQYWANFDERHRDRAEVLYRNAQEGKGQAAALASTLSFNQRVDETLRTTGIIPANTAKSKFTAAQATTYAEFEQKAASAVEQYEMTELAGKRKATGDEMQKVIDGLATKQVFVKQPFYKFDTSKPAAILSADERGRAYVPLGKVPPNEQNAIENVIRSMGRKVTRDKVQRAYGAVLQGDEKAVRAIASE